jgi:hypothetical protein
MNKFILTAVAVAGLIANSAQARIGWDLKKCQDNYGAEVKPVQTTAFGEVHFFKVGEINLRVVLRNEEVKRILYRKDNGQPFSPDEVEVLQKKNQSELLGAEGIEWTPRIEAHVLKTGAAVWIQSLSRQQHILLQCLTGEVNDKECVGSVCKSSI